VGSKRPGAQARKLVENRGESVGMIVGVLAALLAVLTLVDTAAYNETQRGLHSQRTARTPSSQATVPSSQTLRDGARQE
jgi:hypothetical protein